MSSDNEMTNLLLEWHANSFAEGIVATCEALIQTNIDQPQGTKEDFIQTVIGIRAAAKKSIVQQDSTIVGPGDNERQTMRDLWKYPRPTRTSCESCNILR
jgi:hypothetical protein